MPVAIGLPHDLKTPFVPFFSHFFFIEAGTLASVLFWIYILKCRWPLQLQIDSSEECMSLQITTTSAQLSGLLAYFHIYICHVQ